MAARKQRSPIAPDVAADADNLAQRYRERALMVLGIPITIFLLPFAVNNFVQGRWLLGALSVLVVAQTGANSITLLRGHRPPVPVFVFAGTFIAALVAAFIYIGPPAAYWCYPVTLLLHFVATRRQARLLSVLFLVMILPVGFWFLDLATGLRFAVTLILVTFFGELFVDIIIELQNRLTELAVRDPLTGAFNRLQFEASLLEEAERMRRGAGPACLLALDIDNFKPINDELGHAAGDKVLVEIVELIGARLRKTDKMFRVGGEEFMVLLGNTALPGAMAFAEEIRERIRTAGILEERPVTASIGVAELGAGESVESWQQRADALLYAAKQAGRDRVESTRAAGASGSTPACR